MWTTKVLINAGQANAATGPEGEADAEESATSIAEELGIEKDEVLVMSTGVIGHRIKMDSLIYHLPDLTDALARGPQADMTIATAITTTGGQRFVTTVEMDVIRFGVQKRSPSNGD